MSRVDRRPDDLMWTSKPTVITNQRIYISDDLDDIESWIPVRNHSHEHRTLRPETRWVFNFTLILNISLFVLWKMSLSTLIVDNIHCRVSIHLLSVYDSQWLADLCFCRKHDDIPMLRWFESLHGTLDHDRYCVTISDLFVVDLKRNAKCKSICPSFLGWPTQSSRNLRNYNAQVDYTYSVVVQVSSTNVTDKLVERYQRICANVTVKWIQKQNSIGHIEQTVAYTQLGS